MEALGGDVKPMVEEMKSLQAVHKEKAKAANSIRKAEDKARADRDHVMTQLRVSNTFHASTAARVCTSTGTAEGCKAVVCVVLQRMTAAK